MQTTFKAEQIISEAAHVDDTLILPFELRQKSRLVATLASGRQILLSLPRGNVLRHGALLMTNEGSVVQVRSAVEVLSLVISDNAEALARAAYHLGNRHVALQIGHGRLSYLHDHVLDDMMQRLGFSPLVIEEPFEPEQGAYGHAAVHHHHEH